MSFVTRLFLPEARYSGAVAQALDAFAGALSESDPVGRAEANRALNRALATLDSSTEGHGHALPAEVVSYLAAAVELGIVTLTTDAETRLRERYADVSLLLDGFAHRQEARGVSAPASPARVDALLAGSSDILQAHADLRAVAQLPRTQRDLAPGELAELESLVIAGALASAREYSEVVEDAAAFRVRSVRTAVDYIAFLTFGPIGVVSAILDVSTGSLIGAAGGTAVASYALVDVLRNAQTHTREQVRERFGLGSLAGDAASLIPGKPGELDGVHGTDGNQRHVRLTGWAAQRRARAVEQAAAGATAARPTPVQSI